MSRSQRRKRRAAALALVAAAVLGGCAPSVDNNGNIPLPEQIDRIEPGKTTRDDVARLLGSPSAQSTFAKDQTWFYIGKRTETVAFFDPEVLEHKILEIRFDAQGIVTSVEHVDATKTRRVDIVRRVTPTMGKQLTIIEQLIGNVGRFGTSDSSSPSTLEP